MRTLLHMPFDPASRAIRIAVGEKGLPVQFLESPPWEQQEILIAANPAGEIPVLADNAPTGAKICISPALAILEYLEEAYANNPLLPTTSAERAETRRICHWFFEKFEREVASEILYQQIEKRLRRAGAPDHDRLRDPRNALAWHLDYVCWLLDQHHWIACERFSNADIVAFAYLSVLDYLGHVNWKDFAPVKEWYARVKSRPSVRPVLSDRLNGIPPPGHYEDPDF